ncbi:endonuclease domain-containing protein [Sphingomonas sp. So64.6b]|uniref:endonuclease domain-containing protein n=1 Tax=Sphingomonas sp. So64.6b TaxID=2997354 RepID=UPI0015FFA47F|nr:DUF559 domain-containing protein [Sphingomonas sp. So64.6b]QNA83591.1 endonuclease domain-containing protein [Sphingomonas sp. So64.6b]
MRRVPKHMTARARAMRREPSEAERVLWNLLSRYRPAFTRQLSIDDRYIIDLANRTAKLAVELDGSQHHDQANYDAERTAYLEAEGWTVIRLWNSDVISNPEGAATLILDKTAECLGGTHPQPLPSREGRKRAPRYK